MSSTEKPASARQLHYLRGMANRTGQTFTNPQTSSEASAEIERLRNTPRLSRFDRLLERDLESFGWDAEQAARERNCDVPISPEEVEGYGSTAAWKEGGR